MDLWRWITDYARQLAEDGDIRLARLLMRLPEATCDDRHAEVDAMTPELLALVRAKKNPWLEVYVRHWYLQSKILHRHEVAGTLSDAVDLLEFANRPDTRDCPQSVCVTQDLACAYAEIDGPGYADERLSVADETLARIDPTWPCFDCISGEYASALMDAGRLDDTLAFVEAQRRALFEHDVFELGGNLARHRAVTLLYLGRAQEALEQLDAWDAEREGGYRALSKRIITARCLLRELKDDEDWEMNLDADEREGLVQMLPTPREVLPTAGLYELYIDALYEFSLSNLIDNDWRVGRVLRQMNRKLTDNGALYTTAWSALRAAQLAYERGARTVARRLLEEARSGLSRLRRPDYLEPEIGELAEALDDYGDDEILDGLLSPEEHEQLDAALTNHEAEGLLSLASGDPEQDLELVEIAIARTAGERASIADDTRVVMRRCMALGVLGFTEESEALLMARIRRDSNETQLLEMLGETLLENGRAQELLDFLDEFDADTSRGPTQDALWLRVRALRALGETERARKTLRACLEDMPEDDEFYIPMARSLAILERERGAYEEAFDLLGKLRWSSPSPGPIDWEFMIVATLLERWDAVREAAARLDMELPGEGPIDLAGGLCRVRLVDGSGREATYMALRNSPVTARILEITAASDPGGHERHGDVVVFSPAPLSDGEASEESESEEPVDHDDEDSDTQVDARPPLYQVIEILRPGDFESFAIDGVYPGDDAWRALVASIEELGGTVLEYSGDSYELADPEDGEPLLGMYARAAVPAQILAGDIHRILHEHGASFAHPMTWLELARRLDDVDELERQREIAERYGL